MLILQWGGAWGVEFKQQHKHTSHQHLVRNVSPTPSLLQLKGSLVSMATTHYTPTCSFSKSYDPDYLHLH